MPNFSASLTKPKALLHQSRDCSCYVSRPTPVAPTVRSAATNWPTHTHTHTHDSAHTKTRLGKVTLAWSRRLCGNDPALLNAKVWIVVSVNFFWLIRIILWWCIPILGDEMAEQGFSVKYILDGKMKRCTAFIWWEIGNSSRIHLR